MLIFVLSITLKTYIMLSTQTEKSEYLQNVVASYLNTAIWVRFDSDENVSIKDIDTDSSIQAIKDCTSFLDKINYKVESIGSSEFGHDFWLTRNHHGAGFWDRGYGEFGDRLTKIAQSYSEINPVIGDNGKVYFE